MFVAFGIRPNGDVVLEHNLIGSTLSKEELEVSLYTIARVADRVDEEIVERWGGERGVDRIDGLARLLDFEPALLRSVVDVGLTMSGAPPLARVDSPDEASGKDAWTLPPLGDAWQGTLDTLRRARRRDEGFWEWRDNAPPLPVV